VRQIGVYGGFDALGGNAEVETASEGDDCGEEVLLFGCGYSVGRWAQDGGVEFDTMRG
jgi:hypothetical protein